MEQTRGEVHQFHSGTARGDAITDEMLDWQTRLRSLGFRSEIYAQHIAEGLEGQIIDVAKYLPSPETVLFLHHSMGHGALEQILAMQQRVVPIYHNITPLEFIDEPYVRNFAQIGHLQLRQLAGVAAAAIADSNFNRQEMLRAGFTSVSVVPVKTSFAEFKQASVKRGDSRDWLFVGRVVASKGQLDLVHAFADSLAKLDVGQRLILIGDTSNSSYVNQITSLAAHLNISERVRLLGKVSSERLQLEYQSAGLFVSLSKHEGFGVPLLEAMAAGLPVVAYKNAAVAETLGGAGIAVADGDLNGVVAACVSLLADQEFRRSTIRQQHARVDMIEGFDIGEALNTVVAEAQGARRRVSVQVQGPFETSYSLAILNRELACALSLAPELDVSIFATEGPGDYVPRAEDLAKVPEAAALYEKSANALHPDVVIRQMYPPRVDDSPGGLTFQYFGWEESLLPEGYVANFNRHLAGIGVMSSFVKQVLVDSGVTVPIRVVGVGVRRPQRDGVEPIAELGELRSFRFLSISSAFPRKGVDVLLDAYFEQFTGDDDCTLVLKTFPNPHNDVESLLAQRVASAANPPHVVWVNREMSEPEIDALYASASVYVHPARGEGFGLPVAEAMSAGVAVIAPASTGLADFVNADTATTIPFQLTAAHTHLSVPGSLWAEPDREALSQAMRSAFEFPNNQGNSGQIARAQSLVREEFNWTAVAERFKAFIAEVQAQYSPPRIALVSTWNSRCGIAEYTADLVRAAGRRWETQLLANEEAEVIDLRLEKTVKRVWVADPNLPIDSLLANIDGSDPDIVHIQHNFGFFGVEQLATLIRSQVGKRGVVVTLHRTSDLVTDGVSFRLSDIACDLALADRIIVHQEADAANIRALGVERVEIIPIGAPQFGTISGKAARKLLGIQVPNHVHIVSTYGFLLPHKGTLELIQAVEVLRRAGLDVRLLIVSALHPDPTSELYYQQCLAEIDRLGLARSVRFVTEFLQPEVSHLLVSAADVVVLPYSASEESSSASLRFVLTTGRPIATTDLGIFGDAAGSLELIAQPVTSSSVAAMLKNLIASPERQAELAVSSRSLAQRSSIRSAADAHTRMYQAIRSERSAATLALLG